MTLTLRSKVLVYEQVAKNFHFGDAVHHGRFAPRSACGASSSVIASGISRAVLVSLPSYKLWLLTTRTTPGSISTTPYQDGQKARVERFHDQIRGFEQVGSKFICCVPGLCSALICSALICSGLICSNFGPSPFLTPASN